MSFEEQPNSEMEDFSIKGNLDDFGAKISRLGSRRLGVSDDVEELSSDSIISPPGSRSIEDDEDILPGFEDNFVSEDPAGIYLRDIGRISLLKPDQEVELAKAIELGRIAIRTFIENENLSEEEEELLEHQIDEGEDANKKLTEANLRLVVSVARKYMGRGLALQDMIQEGNIGLNRAVEKFDYTKGFRFSTYSYWWIRQAVTRAIADQARTIRVPVHMIELISFVYSQARELQQIIGYEPNQEQLAEAAQISPKRVSEVIRAAQTPISLETPIGENEEGNTIGDFLQDRSEQSTHELATHQILTDIIKEEFRDLNERERKVLTMRFGINDGKERTLGEIGEEIGVSRERVRQIEAEALQKLRNKHQIRQRVREFLE